MVCELLLLVLITGYVICWRNIVIDNRVICGLITSCASCCAKCHFHPFLPVSSITMPPSWKMLPIAKTPENSTFPLFHMKMRYLSHDYASKSYSTTIEQNFFNCINRSNTVNTRVRVTHYIIFGKPHLLHHRKSHLLNYPYYTNCYTIQDQYNYIDMTILLSHCNYIVTLHYIAIYIDTIYR